MKKKYERKSKIKKNDKTRYKYTTHYKICKTELESKKVCLYKGYKLFEKETEILRYKLIFFYKKGNLYFMYFTYKYFLFLAFMIMSIL